MKNMGNIKYAKDADKNNILLCINFGNKALFYVKYFRQEEIIPGLLYKARECEMCEKYGGWMAIDEELKPEFPQVCLCDIHIAESFDYIAEIPIDCFKKMKEWGSKIIIV